MELFLFSLLNSTLILHTLVRVASLPKEAFSPPYEKHFPPLTGSWYNFIFVVLGFELAASGLLVGALPLDSLPQLWSWY
jgi:hypothetical protein